MTTEMQPRASDFEGYSMGDFLETAQLMGKDMDDGDYGSLRSTLGHLNSFLI